MSLYKNMEWAMIFLKAWKCGKMLFALPLLNFFLFPLPPPPNTSKKNVGENGTSGNININSVSYHMLPTCVKYCFTMGGGPGHHLISV